MRRIVNGKQLINYKPVVIATGFFVVDKMLKNEKIYAL